MSQNVFNERFTFEQLQITRERIERVMGYHPNTIPEPFPEMIDEVLSVASEYCDIQGGYSIIDDLRFENKNQFVVIQQVKLNIHKIIFNQIKAAGRIAVFLCTAGPKIGDWAKKLMSEGDLMKGYIVDVVGSEIVEEAMDIIQGNLSQQMKEKGLNITNRYSPGYCQWDVSEQHKLFSLLPQNFCNVKLYDTALMYPIKSVSGIIGIGEKVRHNTYTCHICDLHNCLYRNRKS